MHTIIISPLPLFLLAEMQSSELSSQEDNSDNETSHPSLATTEDTSPSKPHPHTGPLTTSKSTPVSYSSPSRPPGPVRVEGEEMESLQEADDTNPPLVGESSVTESKAPLYQGPTAEYFMNQEAPPTYRRNKVGVCVCMCVHACACLLACSLSDMMSKVVLDAILIIVECGS